MIGAHTRRAGPRRARRVPFGRTAIVLEAAAALLFLGYLLSHEVRLPFSQGTYTLRAAFGDAAGLKTSDNAVVTAAGVPVGRVKKVAYNHGLAVATLAIDDSARRKIHVDAVAGIVPRSALQDLTVDIAPGTPSLPPLAPGATIPASRTRTTVGFDRLIGVLDADTRAQAQVLLGQLAVGLHGRAAGALGPDIAELARVVDSTGRVSAALDDRRALLAQLVSRLDRMFTTLGQRRQQLADAIDGGQRTLAVSAQRDRELAGAIAALPSTLGAVASAMRGVGALSVPLDPALERLQPVARRLPAALAGLRRFVPQGSGLMADIATLAQRGRRPAHDLRSLLTVLGPAARDLRPAARDLLPTLRAVDRNKDGIGELGDRFSGVFSTNDANGPILRGLGFFESFNPADVGFPANASGGQLARAKGESVRALRWVCLHENPAACLARYLVPGLPGSVVPARLAGRSAAGGRR